MTTPLEIEPKLLPFKRREPRCRGSCGFLNLITITCSLAATYASSVLSLWWDQHLPALKRLQDESDMWSRLGAGELSNGLKGQSLPQLVHGPLQPSSNTATPPRSSWHPLLVLRFGSQSHSLSNRLHSVRSDERHVFTIFGSIQIKRFSIPRDSFTSVPRESALPSFPAIAKIISLQTLDATENRAPSHTEITELLGRNLEGTLGMSSEDTLINRTSQRANGSQDK